jgi:hypothetical protein
MALEGTLRDFSLADIFQLIGLQRKTGVLTLRSSEDVVSVSFLDGKVVSAESSSKKLEDRLGQVLMRSGMVSHTQLDAALKAQTETLERLGHALIRLRILSRQELSQALEQQILQIIYRTFRWQDGEYHFSQETSIDYDAEYVTPVNAESILMEGARMLDEWPIIEKRIPRWDVVFVRTSAASQAEVATAEELATFEDIELEVEPPSAAGEGTSKILISPVEHEVLRLVDGRRSVEDVVKRSLFGEFDTCKALYTLLVRSLIREATRDEISSSTEERAVPAPPGRASHARMPWLAFFLLPLLAASMLLTPRNPLNIVIGPSPSLLPLVGRTRSAAMMRGLWVTLQARDTLLGSYPETLNELVREGFASEDGIRDPWGRPYRYMLREQSVLLAGSTAQGAPDPSLILSQYLAAETEDVPAGSAITLEQP